MATGFEPDLFHKCEEPGYLACHVACWIWTIAPAALLLAGTVCNLLSLVVLWRPVLRKFSTTVYLHFLTLSDLGFLWTSVIEKALLFNFRINIRNLSGFTCSVFHWIKFSAGSLSLWILVLLTVERVCYVKWPSTGRRKMTPKFALVACCTALAMVNVINCHLIFGFENIWRVSYIENITDVKEHLKNSSLINITSFDDNVSFDQTPVLELTCTDRTQGYRHFRQHVWIRLAAIIYNHAPMLIILAGNVFVAKKLWSMRRRVVPVLSRENIQSNVQIRAAKIMFALTGFHIICTTPFTSFHFAYTMIDNNLDDSTFANVQLLFAVVMVLMWANYSFNFILYTYTGAIFNREWKNVLQHCKLKLANACSCSRRMLQDEANGLGTITHVHVIQRVNTN